MYLSCPLFPWKFLEKYWTQKIIICTFKFFHLLFFHARRKDWKKYSKYLNSSTLPLENSNCLCISVETDLYLCIISLFNIIYYISISDACATISNAIQVKDTLGPHPPDPCQAVKSPLRQSFRAINFKVNSFPRSDTTATTHTLTPRHAQHRFYLTFDGTTRSDFNLWAGCTVQADLPLAWKNTHRNKRNRHSSGKLQSAAFTYCEFFIIISNADRQTHKVALTGHMSIKVNTRLAYLNDKCTRLYVASEKREGDGTKAWRNWRPQT